MPLEKINHEQRLYVIKHPGGSYSSAGFDYAERIAAGVAAWLNRTGAVFIRANAEPGTRAHFEDYQRALAAGATHHRKTGARCDAELEPALRGLEGWRVEMTWQACDGSANRDRFIVGKSMGWLPCHLRIQNRASHGGPAVYVPDGAHIRPLYDARK